MLGCIDEFETAVRNGRSAEAVLWNVILQNLHVFVCRIEPSIAQSFWRYLHHFLSDLKDYFTEFYYVG